MWLVFLYIFGMHSTLLIFHFSVIYTSHESDGWSQREGCGKSWSFITDKFVKCVLFHVIKWETCSISCYKMNAIRKEKEKLTHHFCAHSLRCIPLFVAPWTVALQASLPMEFSKQEYWGGLPFPFPEDLSDSGIEPTTLGSPAMSGRSLTTGATLEPLVFLSGYYVSGS